MIPFHYTFIRAIINISCHSPISPLDKCQSAFFIRGSVTIFGFMILYIYYIIRIKSYDEIPFYRRLIMLYILILALAFLTWILPLPGKIILLGINFFLPDPLPFGDEIIQILGFVKTSRKGYKMISKR